MSNKIVVIANKKFEPGLIAFINSYRKAEMKTPLVIIDTGLEHEYPYETIKKDSSKFNFKRAEWMDDASPYFQLELGDINADKIIYMEVDMLLLRNIDYLFDFITDDPLQAISVMDNAALALANKEPYVDSAGRFFTEESYLRERYRIFKGYNGGLVGGSKSFYDRLQKNYELYVRWYEKDYRLLAQSLLNQYFIDEDVKVYDVGLAHNFSGINEYYDHPELYKISFDDIGVYPIVKFNNRYISVLHFTGKNKPFLNDEKNILSPVWDYFYNKGRLF